MLGLQKPFNLGNPSSQGIQSSLAWHLPRRGADLPDLFDPATTNLFDSDSTAAYFFSSRIPTS